MESTIYIYTTYTIIYIYVYWDHSFSLVLSTTCPVHSKTNLCADDTSIYASHRDPATVGNMLEEDLRDIGQWLDVSGMKMNVIKSQLMVMCGHKKKHLEDQLS